MKRFSLLILCALACASFVAANDTVRILGIGNSFTMDAMEDHLQPIMSSMDQPAIMAYPYRGGTTLQQHDNWKSRQDTMPYQYFEWYEEKFYDGGDRSANLTKAVKKRAWDYVIIQTDHALSGKLASYDPYLTQIIQFVKDSCSNKKVKIGLYMTWAYDSISTYSGFARYKYDTQIMYDSIINAVRTVMKKHQGKDIDFLIPVGTAIQNARTSFKGHTLTRDGYHLNYDYGRYIASLAWSSVICGFDPDSVPFYPSTISEYCANMCRAAVKGALALPYDTTSLRKEFGKSESGSDASDESRLERVTFNGLSVPIVKGQYEYTVKINSGLEGKVAMYSFPLNRKCEQNITNEAGSDIPRDPKNYGYFPMDAPEKGDTVTYYNRVIATDLKHVTRYIFHLVGAEEQDLVYTISSRDDLKDFAAAVNGGQYGLNAELTRDINLDIQKQDCWKTPIGTIEHPYTGTFDGKGYVLENFNIYSNGDSALWKMSSLGLFGAIKGATIKNLTLTSREHDECYFLKPSSGTPNNKCCGVLVGWMANSTISGCYLDVNVYTTMKCPVGAMVGLEEGKFGSSKIDRCEVSGTWRARQTNYYGAFVGQANNVEITNSYSRVRMPLETDHSAHIGGFIGKSLATGENEVLLKNCYFAGYIQDDRAKKGAATTNTPYLASMIAEVDSANTTISNCYYLEASAPKDVATAKGISPVPTAVVFPQEVLTNGMLASKLGEAFVQGEEYPVIAGDERSDWAFRGRFMPTLTVLGTLTKTTDTIHVDAHSIICTTKSNGAIKSNGKEWRTYVPNDFGPVTVQVDKGYWIDSVIFVYNAKNDAVLSDVKSAPQEAKYTSGQAMAVEGTERTWYTSNTTGATDAGFLGFTDFLVSYYKLPESIKLPDTVQAAVGNAFYVGQVVPADAYHVWSSSNEAVVLVDQWGKMVAMGEGEAVVRVVSKNDIKDSCVVVVSGVSGEGFTEDFSALGEIDTLSNTPFNKDSLSYDISWTLRNVKRDASDIIDGQQGLELQCRVIGQKDKDKDKNYIAYKNAKQEGGVKAIAFQWRAVDTSKPVVFDVDSTTNNKKPVNIVSLAANSLWGQAQYFSKELNFDRNLQFRIRLADTLSSNVVFGPLTITPYLLYRNKNVVLNAVDYVGTGLTYTNDSMFNHTDNVGIQYMLAGNKDGDVAGIDAKTGAVSAKAAGTVTVKAVWGGVSTTYSLTFRKVTIPNLGFEMPALDTVVDMNAQPFVNEVVNIPEQGAGTVTYSSSNERVATVDKLTGRVSIIGEGKAVITGTVSEGSLYRETKTSYSISVEEPVGEAYLLESFTGMFWPLDQSQVEGDVLMWNNTNTRRKPTDLMKDGVTQATWFSYKAPSSLQTQLEIEGGVKRVAFPFVKAQVEDTVRPSFVVRVGSVVDSVDATGMSNVDARYNRNFMIEQNARLTITNDTLTAFKVAAIKITPYLRYLVKDTTIRLKDYLNPAVPFVNKQMINNTDNEGITYQLSGTSVASLSGDTLTILGAGIDTVKAYWKGVVTSYVIRVEMEKPQIMFESPEVAVNKVQESTYQQELTMVSPTTGDVEYSIVGAPAGIVIDKATGEVSLQDAEVGVYTIKALFLQQSYYMADSATYQLYVDTLPQPKVQFTEKQKEVDMNAAPFVNAIMTQEVQALGKIMYTSSDPAVAQVNDTTGQVTVVGQGQTEIRALIERTEDWAPTKVAYVLTVTDPGEASLLETFAKDEDWQIMVTQPTTIQGDLFEWVVDSTRHQQRDVLASGERAVWFDTLGFVQSKDTIEGGIKRLAFHFNKAATPAPELPLFMVAVGDTTDTIDASAYMGKDKVYNRNFFVKKQVPMQLRNGSSSALLTGAIKITPYLLYMVKDTTIFAGDYVSKSVVFTNNQLINNTMGEGTISYRVVGENADKIAAVDDKGAVTVKGVGKVRIEAQWQGVTTGYDLTVNRSELQIGFAQTTMTKTLNDLPFTQTVQGVPQAGAGQVTYTSSDVYVARVDEQSGLVTVVGEGSAQIIASVAEGELYKEGSAQYTLTVTDPKDPAMVETFKKSKYAASATPDTIEGDLAYWENQYTRRTKDGSVEKLADGSLATWFNAQYNPHIQSTEALEGGIKRVAFKWNKAHAGERTVKFFVSAGATRDSLEKTLVTESDKKLVKPDMVYNHNFFVKENVSLRVENSNSNNCGLLIGDITITPYIGFIQRQMVVYLASVRNVPFSNTTFINNTNGEGTLSFSSSKPEVVSVDNQGNVTVHAAADTVTITASWVPAAGAKAVTATYQLVVIDNDPEEGTFILETLSTCIVDSIKDTFVIGDSARLSWHLVNCTRRDAAKDKVGGYQGSRLAYGGYIEYEAKQEGGIKKVIFDWRAAGVNYPVHFKVTVGDSVDDFHHDALTDVSTICPYVHTFADTRNTTLRIMNGSKEKPQQTLPIIGAIKIVPYLFYTTKKVVLDAASYKEVGYKYINTNLINNTDSSNISYSLSGYQADQIASIDAKTGEVTIKQAGSVTVLAKWKGVITTYRLIIQPSDPQLSFANPMPTVQLKEGSYTQTVTKTTEAVATYVFEEDPGSATIDALTGTVSFSEPSMLFIRAEVPALFPYAQGEASYILIVDGTTDLQVPQQTKGAKKTIRNNELFIISDEQVYDAQGRGR